MADYYPLIARAVSSLGSNTGEARQALYERARAALISHLRGQEPPLPQSEIMREEDALEAATRRVEAEWSTSNTPETETAVQVTSQPPQSPTTNPEVNFPGVLPDRKNASADDVRHITLTEPTKLARELPSTLPPIEDRGRSAQDPHAPDARKNAATNAIKTVGTVMLSIACSAALVFVAVTFIRGLAWAADHVFEYLTLPVSVAFTLCLVIFLPLAIFRTTRFISVYGFLASSYLFGATTWILGFLTTLQYWGGIGVIIGLLLGIIGIVPLGIMASALHADWWSVAVLIVGLFVTYLARTVAFGLAARSEML